MSDPACHRPSLPPDAVARARARRPQLYVLAVISVALLTGVTISTTPVKFRGGSMELNTKLRPDRLASASIPAGRFFANGTCPAGAPDVHECRLTSMLQFSTIGDGALRNLRRSRFLWIEDGVDVSLFYEFAMRSVSIVSQEDESVIAANVDVGMCVPMVAKPPHLLLDPETRLPIRGMENRLLPNGARSLSGFFDVALGTCGEWFLPGPPSGSPAPPSECNNGINVLRILPSGSPLRLGDNPPVCMTALQLPRAKTVDRSYTLTPRPAELFGVEDTAAIPIIGWVLAAIRDAQFAAAWENATLAPQVVEPHLKVVPLNGIRSIARPMTATALTPLPDGSQVSEWEYRVAIEDGKWLENFSPQVIVSRARFRIGAWGAPNMRYPQVERFKLLYRGSPENTCQTRTGNLGGNEHDIVLCHADRMLNVSPAYTADMLALRPVDDGDRPRWNVRIRLPAGTPPLTESSLVFIEFDLTAFAGDTSAGALHVTPVAHHMNARVLPRGTMVLRGQVFRLHNAGVTGVRIEQVTITGPDAAEFGPVHLHPLPDISQLVTLPTAVTPPAPHSAGRSFALSLAPVFRSSGPKSAEITVHYRDHRNATHTVRAALTATVSN